MTGKNDRDNFKKYEVFISVYYPCSHFYFPLVSGKNTVFNVLESSMSNMSLNVLNNYSLKITLSILLKLGNTYSNM